MDFDNQDKEKPDSIVSEKSKDVVSIASIELGKSTNYANDRKLCRVQWSQKIAANEASKYEGDSSFNGLIAKYFESSELTTDYRCDGISSNEN